MLHFVTGRAGSGKTRYVRSLLADAARAGNDKLILIVPEQFSFDSERAMLSMLGAKDALNVEILSFTRLADRIFKAYGGVSCNPVDDGGRIILMSVALQSVKDNLTLYARHAQSASLAAKMLEICAEFKQCAISPEMLMSTYENMDNCILRQKLYELSLIMSAYNALLKQSYSDELDSLTRLHDVLLQNRFFDGYTVVIDAFKGFTTQETEIISRIMTQADDVFITLTTDSIFGKDGEIDAFSCVKRTAKKIMRDAKKSNVRIADEIKLPLNPENTRFKNDALRHLEANIFGSDPISYDSDASCITVCAASDIASECEYVAANAKRLMRTHGIRCRDIAVIARKEEDYRGELLSAFKKYDIPVFEDNRQPIASQPLITLVRCAFEIACSGLSTDSLMRYLKTGLCGFDDAQIAAVENYAYMWQIKGSGWKQEWTQHPDGLGCAWSEEAKKRLLSLNKTRAEITTPLNRFKRACTDAAGEKIARAVFDLLEDIRAAENLKNLALLFQDNGNPALAVEQERIWDMLMDILDKLAVSLGQSPVSAARCAALFDAVLSVSDIGSIPQGLDEITIGSADRIRLCSPKVVFLVGANEGVFPLNPGFSGILSDIDRRKLIEMGVEVSEPSEFKAQEEIFIAYNAICSASERLFISFPRADNAGEALRASAMVSQVEALFPECNTADTELLDVLDFIESEQSAFEACAKVYAQSSGFSAELKEYFNSRENYRGKMAALKRVVSDAPFKFENTENAEKLFGKDLYMSASRIEVYHKCPFEYFCKYGLNAKPRTIAELDPMQSGTVIHYVLENIIKKHGAKGLCGLSEEKRKTEVRSLLSDYLNSSMGGLDDKPKRFGYLFGRLAKTLDDVVYRLCLEFEVSAFEPVDFELNINHDGAVKPYELALPDGGMIKITGSVDRVDKYEKDGVSYIRVIDYKSGGKDFLLSDILFGLNMQMLIYLFAIAENGEAKYGKIVPSGILYYPAKMNVTSLPRGCSEDEFLAKKIKDGMSNGILLNDMAVLDAMENGLAGRFIPVKLKSGGAVDGALISLSELGRLKQQVDDILVEMALSLHRGDINACPAQGKNYQRTCEWCDYGSVCGFDTGKKAREITALPHKKSLEILNGGDADEQKLD